MKTNLLYAIRNIKNNKVNSIITVVGLSVAVACSLIIYFYIKQEYSYNSFHKNADSIYRINYDIGYVDGTYDDMRLEPELAELLPEKIPEIHKSAEYRNSFQQVVKVNENYFDANIGLASEEYFNMFSFEFLLKISDTIFHNPYEVVLTKTLADNILPEGKSYAYFLESLLEFPLAYPDQPFQIVGIIDDIPENSTMNFDAIVSGETGRNFGGCDNNFGYTTIFYQLKPDVNAGNAERNINNYLLDYYDSRISNMQSQNQLVSGNEAFVPFSTSLHDNHLCGVFSCFESSVEKRNFIILGIIGILILLIATSNYTILSLGQYLKKVGDVGIRKAMGANSSNVFLLFFSESLIVTLGAFILGVLLSIAFIPLFGIISQTEIHKSLINVSEAVFFCSLLFFGIVLFTSIIPIFVFSKVSPHQMASKKINVGNKSKISQLFVSFQYSLSIILIIVTVFINRQSNYLKTQSLGMNTVNVLDVGIDRIDRDKKQLFADLVREHPGVESATLTSRNFMNGSSNSYVDKGDGEQVMVYRFKVDHDYVKTLGLNLTHGRDFTFENLNSSDANIIVNQKFVEAMGIQDEPISKTYDINGRPFTIIGVVADYHFQDLRRRVRPAVLFARTNWNNGFYNMLLSYHPNQIKEVRKHIEECYEQVAPGKTLNIRFWNEQLNQRYQEEERWSKIVGYASLIAIIISTLGLFGLTILLINQKVKEIGVRKVNGAKSMEVLVSINKTFVIWLFGSLIIAIPIAYSIVNNWLDTYPYRVEISWWIFVVSGAFAMGIALLSVSFQSYKAASRNPVEALRYE